MSHRELTDEENNMLMQWLDDGIEFDDGARLGIQVKNAPIPFAISVGVPDPDDENHEVAVHFCPSLDELDEIISLLTLARESLVAARAATPQPGSGM